jgi:hypothetical protein
MESHFYPDASLQFMQNVGIGAIERGFRKEQEVADLAVGLANFRSVIHATLKPHGSQSRAPRGKSRRRRNARGRSLEQATQLSTT